MVSFGHQLLAGVVAFGWEDREGTVWGLLVVEAVCLEVSLDFWEGSVDGGAEDLFKLSPINSSKQLSLHLEYKNLRLCLNGACEAAEQYILLGGLFDFVNLSEGSVDVEIFKEGLKENAENIRGATLDSNWERFFFEGVLADLVLWVRLSSSKNHGSNDIAAQNWRFHLDDSQEVVAVWLGVSKNCCEEASVVELIRRKAIHKQPVKEPRHCLSVLLGRHASIVVPFVDDATHFLEGCVLDDVSAFTVENLTSKEAPEYLEHEFRVLLGFVYEDLFQAVQDLFRFYK